MLKLIKGKKPDQVHGQHLGPKRILGFRPGGDSGMIAGPELTIPVDGCGAHQVAHIHQPLRLGLAPVCKAIAGVLKQSQAPVCPRQDKISGFKSSGLLKRRLLPKTVNVSIAGNAIEKNERSIPSRGDDPVRPVTVSQRVGEDHQGITLVRQRDGIDRRAITGIIQLKALAGDLPVFRSHATYQ